MDKQQDGIPEVTTQAQPVRQGDGQIDDVDGCPSMIEDKPVLRDWEPAPLFSVLGAAVGYFFWVCLAFILRPIGAWVVQTIVVAVYGIVFYRSYFTTRPLITSSRVISFLNYAVTVASTVISVTFGRCMNENLKKSHNTKLVMRGISYIVAIVYFCATIGIMHVYENVRYGRGSSLQSSSAASQPTTQSTDNSSPSVPEGEDSAVFSDALAGASFILPDGWHSEELNEEREYIRWKARPDATGLVWVTYGAGAADGIEMDDIMPSDLSGTISSVLHDCTDETVEQVAVGPIDYWKISGSGYVEQDGQTAEMHMIEYLTVTNEKAYYFTLYDGLLEPDSDAYREDFESLVGSLSFE